MEEKVIALFKLLSGEEVVAEYKTDFDSAPDIYFFKSPRRIFLQQMNAQGALGIKMAPWIVGNPDGVFPIHASHVITMSIEMNGELKTGYLQQTSPIDLSVTQAASKIVV